MRELVKQYQDSVKTYIKALKNSNRDPKDTLAGNKKLRAYTDMKEKEKTLNDWIDWHNYPKN